MGVRVIISVLFTVVLLDFQAWGVEPEVDRSVHGPFHFRDFRTVNSAGIGAGDFLTFGVDVLPNGDSDGDGFADSDGFPILPTTVIATQGAASIPLNFSPSGVDASGESFDPNHFVRSIIYNASLTGRWNFVITNDGDTITQLTGAVGDVAAMPKVKDMSLTGSGQTPTFHWSAPEIPVGLTLDSVAIEIRDFDQRNDRGTAKRIFNEVIDSANTSFTMPAGVLLADHKYSVGIQLDDRRSTGGVLSRSRSFFDFSTVSLDVGNAPVFLPSVDTTGISPIYTFDVTVDAAGQTIFIDPPVAIGYDYKIGPGDPNFASVLLPSAGDNFFDLYLWNSTDNRYEFYMTIGANVKVDFPFGGVDRFRILGIEPSSGLDPNNVTAFVTGLTFVSSGQFTGTMAPIVSETVNVELKPGDGPNCINPNSKGVVAVAILGNEIDVTTINPSTIVIDDDSNPATAGVEPDKFSTKDVNDDGKLDLVVHFRVQDLNAAGLLGNGQTLYITGQFSDGKLMIGSDVMFLSNSLACQ